MRKLNVILLFAWIASPALADQKPVALIMGNHNYTVCGVCDNPDGPGDYCDEDTACPQDQDCLFYGDLPGVIGDILNKQNALENAGWNTSTEPNKKKAEMEHAINTQLPPQKGICVGGDNDGGPCFAEGDCTGTDPIPDGVCVLQDTPYIVWYAGHGDLTNNGALVGINCATVTAADLVRELKGREALVILDSCGGGDFANEVNTERGGIPAENGVGVITAGGKDQCPVADGPQKGLFSECFVNGLNGAADADEDGNVTVAEAMAYADLNCFFPRPPDTPITQAPTWDGEHGEWVIGKTKDPIPKPLCNGAGTNAGCWTGCEEDACDAQCDLDLVVQQSLEEWQDTVVEETNFLPVHLALVQAGDKINWFQEAVLEVLVKQKPSPKKILKIANVQDAIDAILADYVEQGGKKPIDVAIFGHGRPGHFKIGEDWLEDPTVQEKFANALNGKIDNLVLYGCSVGAGHDGQKFITKLSKALKPVKIKVWTGKVYAVPNKWPHEGGVVPEKLQNKFFVEGEKKKEEIPAVTEWGMAVMVLLVLAAGTVVIRGLRSAPA